MIGKRYFFFSISIYDHDVDGKIQIVFIEHMNGSK